MSRAASKTAGRFCRLLKCKTLLEERVDRLGRVTLICPSCERRRRHQCVDCGRPVSGKAWRCAVHLIEQRRKNDRVCHARCVDARRAKDRRRWRSLTPEQREEIRRQRRLRSKRDPQRYEKQRAWNDAHRIWYLHYHRNYNRRPGRAEAKRAQARARYYEQHPVRPKPTCLVCGAPIDWTPGNGRPALRCPAHNQWRKRRESA